MIQADKIRLILIPILAGPPKRRVCPEDPGGLGRPADLQDHVKIAKPAQTGCICTTKLFLHFLKIIFETQSQWSIEY